jgi:regulator of protease activity HflC (stomatin/prohibitin superfamily)
MPEAHRMSETRPDDVTRLTRAVPWRWILPPLILIGLLIAFVPIVIVQPGQVAVQVRFGAVQDHALAEGVHLVDPVSRFPRMTVRRQILEMSSGGAAGRATGGAELVALSADQLPMLVDIGFPYALNAEGAARVFQRLGDDASIQNLILPAARTAVRDAIARFGWEDAATHKREELAALIGDRFRHLIEADLRGLGLTAAEAGRAFLLPPAQLRRIVPPQSVQDAIAEKLRAQQDLQKQETLTQIARMEAERRASEGVGLSRLFGALPEGFSADQIATILNAMASKTRADAMLQAAQTHGVQTIIMDAGGAVPVQVVPRAAR